MTNRNDRSVHTDHMKVARNLARHDLIMKKLEELGAPRLLASKLAFQVVLKKLTEAEAVAKVEAL